MQRLACQLGELGGQLDLLTSTPQSNAAMNDALAKELIDAIKNYQTPKEGQGLQYELFYNDQQEAAIERQRIAKLEQRITQLEAQLGEHNGGHSLGSTVAGLEQRLALLDEKKLDRIAARVLSLVQKYQLLERQKQARELTTQEEEEAKKIQCMLAKLDRVDEFQGAFPKIVDRLKCLKEVHENSVHFQDRLVALESSRNATSAMLQQDVDMLHQLEKTMEKNLAIFEENLKHL